MANAATSGGDVRQRGRHALRLAVTGDAHHPGAGLGDQVVPGAPGVGSGQPEPGQCTYDEVWEPFPQQLGVQPVRGQLGRIEVDDEHVGGSRSRNSTSVPGRHGCRGTRLFLFRLTERNHAASPLRNGGPHARASSPRVGSTLMTSAPMSPRYIDVVGAA